MRLQLTIAADDGSKIEAGAPAIAIVAALALAVELFDKKDGNDDRSCSCEPI